MVDVKEAARILDVTPRRVRSMIEAGTLPATKFAGSWDVDPASLRRARPQGRPMSIRIAWATSQLADEATVTWLSAQERYRANQMIHRLRDADTPASLVASWVARRAERSTWWAESPEDILADDRLVPSGVNDARVKMSVAQYAEGYVTQRCEEMLRLDHGIIKAAGRTPNVVLHTAVMLPPDPVPLWFLIADLVEYGPGREHSRAEVIAKDWQNRNRR